MMMTAEEHEEFRRKVIRDRIANAERREHEAAMDRHRAMADLAELEGREWDREYSEAFIAAQTHQPGGHDRFWALVSERDARDVLAGKRVLTDFLPHERAGIERAMERLRAECKHEGDDGPFFAKCGKCGETLDDFGGTT